MKILEAIKEGNSTKIIKLVKEFGINEKVYNGKTVLHYAVEVDNITSALTLIRQGADVDAQDKNGYTPLYNATCNENIPMIKFLLNNGANPNIPENYLKTTPLFIAAESGNIAIMELLYTHEAKTNPEDCSTSPLHFACRSNNPLKSIESLLKHGANPNFRDPWGNTPRDMLTATDSSLGEKFDELLVSISGELLEYN